MKRPNFSAAVLLLGLVLGGCTTTPAPEKAMKLTTAAGVDGENFVALDPIAQAGVQGCAVHERVLPDGRLEVAAELQNLSEKPLRLNLNCVFKDAQDVALKDEVPMRVIEVAAGAIETVRFTAPNPAARHYTVRVGTAR